MTTINGRKMKPETIARLKAEAAGRFHNRMEELPAKAAMLRQKGIQAKAGGWQEEIWTEMAEEYEQKYREYKANN